MAVDSQKGYLFFADDISVTMYSFNVDLGENRINPSISIDNSSSQVVFRDSEITAITVDSDNSALYISSLQGITILMYSSNSQHKYRFSP